jgi:SAM-dependent methyltransferase
MNQPAAPDASRQRSLDAANAAFWNELCGSALAAQHGISGHGLDSLRAFDEAYLRYYPYLLERIPVATMAGERVLEVGLGYGTLGQRIVEAGARYVGLDIAESPARLMTHRLRLQGLPGGACRGSVLDCPFPAGSFDCVVAVGCFHHTGDARRAVAETWRVLRPGGRAYIMVYNKFSVRQWLEWPLVTALELARESGVLGRRDRVVTRDQRGAYDASLSGQAAPETQFFSVADMRRLFGRFASVRARKENCTPVIVAGRCLASRHTMLRTVGPVAGLDLYISAIK